MPSLTSAVEATAKEEAADFWSFPHERFVVGRERLWGAEMGSISLGRRSGKHRLLQEQGSWAGLILLLLPERIHTDISMYFLQKLAHVYMYTDTQHCQQQRLVARGSSFTALHSAECPPPSCPSHPQQPGRISLLLLFFTFIDFCWENS